MPLSAFRLLLAKRLPGLGRYKRATSAMWQARSKVRGSYSQGGEDRYVLERLQDFRLDDSIYIDVGANHPMSLSNTYLLYRHGLRGIVIDPIGELIELHRRFRSRDLALCAACGARPAVAEFTVTKAPVFSTLGEIDAALKWRTELVPVVTLDMLIEHYDPAWVCFLNVDVEGHDLAVLQGAARTLDRVFLLCVEARTDRERNSLSNFLEQRDFRLTTTIRRNLIFENRSPAMQRLLDHHRRR